MNRVEDLLALWREDALSEEELAELELALSTREARAVLVQDFFLTSDLGEILQESRAAAAMRNDEAVFSRAEPKKNRNLPRPAVWLPFFARLGIACAVVAAGGYLLARLWLNSSPSAEGIAVLRTSGPGVILKRNGHSVPVEKETALLPGDGIQVGPTGKAGISFSDTTRLEIGAETLLAFPDLPDQKGMRIELNQGSLIAQVARQPSDRPMAIKTPVAEATVIGTEFQLHVKNGSTRLNVREGIVRFQRLSDGMEACVSKGEQSIATSHGSSPLAVTRTEEGAFQEKFEDAHLDSRGWYDMVSPLISNVERIKGSRSSAEFQFVKGGIAPASGNAIRRRFSAADAVQVDYWIKHGPNWASQGPVFHIMLMTNKNDDWEGAGYTHLTVLIGMFHAGPAIFVQDGQNMDETRLGQDLTRMTELRAVAGGNGDSDGHGEGIWYPMGRPEGVHSNQKMWTAGEDGFGAKPGRFYKGDWHQVRAWVRLNTIANGRAVPDGQLKYWFDGELVMNYSDVVLRTAAQSDMQFNQFLIAPYITGGAPEDQTLWMDDLTVVPEGVP